MPNTIPRQASKPVQQKTSASVVSNLKNLKHMRSNMLDRCGHASSVIKSQKVMTNTLFTNTTGPNMRGGTCIGTFDACSIDGHPYGNDKQYTVWWHMQEDHSLQFPLGCPTCDGTFCSKQTQQKHIPTCLGKRDKFGPKQTPYAEKKFKCDECAKKYTTQAALLQCKKVHRGTNKQYVCSLCGKALSSTTALHKTQKDTSR